MQDIDFEALDQAVSKIMDQAKIDSEHIKQVERVKKQRRMGRSMDVISVDSKKSTPVTAQSLREAKQAAVRAMNVSTNRRSMQDVVKSKKSASVSKPKMTIAPKTNNQQPKTADSEMASASLKAATNSIEATKNLATAHQVGGAVRKDRRAELLRQRRRGVVSGTVKAESESSEAVPAVMRGKIQTETLSTKQPDGTETVYNRSEFDYAVKVGEEETAVTNLPRVAMPRALEQRREPAKPSKDGEQAVAVSTSQIGQAETRRSSVIDLDDDLVATKVETAPNADLTKSSSNPDRPYSPFLETAKVEKRPLGMPEPLRPVAKETMAPEITFGDDDLHDEPNLYSGGSRLADEPDDEKKSHWLIWVIAILVVLVILGLVFYFVYLYNN